jgi:WD40 repeat protein
MQESAIPFLPGRVPSDLRPEQSGKNSGPHSSPNTPKVNIDQEMTSCMAVSHMTLSPAHGGSVKCMTVIKDHVWVGGGDGTISIWSASTKQLIQELLAHQDGSKPSPINNIVVVDEQVWASQDTGLLIWSLRSFELVKRLKGQSYGALLPVEKNIWCSTIEAPNAIHLRSKEVSL